MAGMQERKYCHGEILLHSSQIAMDPVWFRPITHPTLALKARPRCSEEQERDDIEDGDQDPLSGSAPGRVYDIQEGSPAATQTRIHLGRYTRQYHSLGSWSRMVGH
jgi:hypothetical protein